MIKYFLSSVLVSVALFGKPHSMTTPSKGQSKMHQMQQKHPDRLPDDQRHVLFMLSPLYQRIYLYALDDDQREMVAVFERRGESPYKSIDSILERDRRLSDPEMRKRISPAEKRRHMSRQKKYIISEQKKNMHHEEDVMAENSDEYEIYDQTEYKRSAASREKPSYKHYSHEKKDHHQKTHHEMENKRSSRGCCNGDCQASKTSPQKKRTSNQKKGEKSRPTYGNNVKYKYEEPKYQKRRCNCPSSR